jgi:hypothetical protein
LVETVEQDGGVLLERDRSAVSVDLASLGLHSARLSAISPTLAAHVRTVAVSTVNL